MSNLNELNKLNQLSKQKTKIQKSIRNPQLLSEICRNVGIDTYTHLLEDVNLDCRSLGRYKVVFHRVCLCQIGFRSLFEKSSIFFAMLVLAEPLYNT